jgi:DNA-directed RNA polymerase III subunit RPC3
MIQEKWGIIGCRIWRILEAKKKLDEKQVSKTYLTIRFQSLQWFRKRRFVNAFTGCSKKALYFCRYVAVRFIFKDVPKTADHSASRTFFLWYVSFEKTLDLVVKRCYKTLANIKSRVIKETSDRLLLLEKTKRLDVMSGQASLDEADRKGLENLKNVLERLKAAEIRLQFMVLILRDI